MAVSVRQLWEKEDVNLVKGSFTNRESTATKSYVVTGVDNETEAAQAAYNYAPESFGYTSIRGRKYAIPKYKAVILDRAADKGSWTVQVEYSFNNSDDLDDDDEEREVSRAEFSFEVSPATAHVNQPLRQQCVYSSDGVLLTMQQAATFPIGWNGLTGDRCEITGVDIPYGEIREKATKNMRVSTVTSVSWRRKIASVAECVNLKRFNGWEPGEVMFLGVSYTAPLKGVGRVLVTFDFLIRQNEEHAVVQGIDIGKKYGHEYAWAMQQPNGIGGIIPSGSQGYGFVRPRYIFRSEVSKYADLSVLGI